MEHWGWRGTLAATVVAVAVAGVGGAAAYAASGSSEPGMHFAGPPGGPPPHTANRPAATWAEPVLHGESVRSDGHGGYTTELTQTGTITAMAAERLTIRSSDGYQRDYVVRAQGSAPFGVGDDVTVTATRQGEAAVLDTMRPPQ